MGALHHRVRSGPPVSKSRKSGEYSAFASLPFLIISVFSMSFVLITPTHVYSSDRTFEAYLTELPGSAGKFRIQGLRVRLKVPIEVKNLVEAPPSGEVVAHISGEFRRPDWEMVGGSGG